MCVCAPTQGLALLDRVVREEPLMTGPKKMRKYVLWTSERAAFHAEETVSLQC